MQNLDWARTDITYLKYVFRLIFWPFFALRLGFVAVVMRSFLHAFMHKANAKLLIIILLYAIDYVSLVIF